VLIVDRFGNVSLNLSHDELAGTGIVLGGQVELRVGAERYLANVAHTFADVRVGDILVYEDSYRALSIAINRGDAAATMQVAPDAEVRITPR
jgi:S-adenosylmethionine hydrolase